MSSGTLKASILRAFPTLTSGQKRQALETQAPRGSSAVIHG